HIISFQSDTLLVFDSAVRVLGSTTSGGSPAAIAGDRFMPTHTHPLSPFVERRADDVLLGHRHDDLTWLYPAPQLGMANCNSASPILRRGRESKWFYPCLPPIAISVLLRCEKV